MANMAEKNLREIAQRTEEGYLNAKTAIEMAVAQGYLAVGTSVSREGYEPTIPLSAAPLGENIPTGWRPLICNKRGGTIPIARATRVADTALWAAMGGDVNRPLQTTGRPLLPEGKLYDLGTFGWVYDEKSGLYAKSAHTDLMQAVQDLPPEQIVGAIDFTPNGDNFSVDIPEEPGHVGSTTAFETRATLPVSAYDIQQEFANSAVITYNYTPLSR